MIFSQKIQKLRKAKRLSQKEFGKKLGIHDEIILQWESGTSYPSINELIKISDVFNITTDSLLKDNINEYEDDWETDIIMGCAILGMACGFIFDNDLCLWGCMLGTGITYFIKGIKKIKYTK
ncbi:helix-turn-helix domain-containing protein [Clostridium botulinum]|uniref:helix-turn-helix domain-containing protein n=1 Tax=Clostridium botulinum TaxID=1491 RepID=UPI0004DA424A|nr:helix-turn-helix transcriptional regulator [Clostridium botulinum]KEH96829.1 hypothetical protein Z953_13875 [Clostridium botulinum D str. 16868]NFF61148.1 helix-turn-helix transcriptional regulator [Clostridium botulinum]NFL03994.1 helix-turn-helix transcriptional regulator [Clostridium botulinum]